MGLLNKLFGQKKELPATISGNNGFWTWFISKEHVFFSNVNRKQKAGATLQLILDQLQKIHPNIFALIGMPDGNTAELILTADGDIKTVAFIDDIIAAAPQIARWKFTSLKPAIGFEDCKIEMNGLVFSKEKIHFYTTHHDQYPDDIEINIVHEDYTGTNHNNIGNGTLIFLDNAIGELKMITHIDNIDFTERPAGTELIPIEKLNDYLLWREKEFVEKYDEIKYDASQDEYSVYEAEDNNHYLILAVMNRQLLTWQSKASHPWMLTVKIKYAGDRKGMPDKNTYELMNGLEDELLSVLKDKEGYLYLGRETYKNDRNIYIACKEFRKCSVITHEILKKYEGKLQVSYSIFKDKYWRVLNRFVP